MMRCEISSAARLDSRCLDCGHLAQEHWFPTGLCLGCIEAKFELQEELHDRIDRLSFAVQVLTERLDAGRIEAMERRLNEFVSRWPRDRGAT